VIPLRLAVLLLAGAAASSAAGCAPPPPEPSALRPAFEASAVSGEPALPLAGHIRALLVFVRFEDDAHADACTRGFREWPPEADLPASARHVLAPSPEPPFPDSSLTAFFYAQSRGHLVVYGDAVGYRAGPAARYAAPSGALDKARLSREVLDHLSRTLPLAEYDAIGDGFLDQVLVVVRNPMGLLHVPGIPRAQGHATLGAGGRIGEVSVHPVRGGVYQWYQPITPLRDNVLMLAHELGHHLFNRHGLFGNHLDPVAGNAVPYHPPAGAAPDDHARADRVAGYGLMTDGQGPNATGFVQMSAFERHLAGLAGPSRQWIECRPPAPGPNALRDVYRTGDCVRIPLDTLPSGSGGRAEVSALYLSHVARSSPFTAVRSDRTTIGEECPGCHAIDRSFPATGLLVELGRHRTARPFQARRDVVPADNRLSHHPPCELPFDRGAALAETHADDLWGPRHGQLSPWTRPNVYGYTFARDVPSGHLARGWPVLDSLRYGPEGTLAFDYYPDPFALDTFTVRRDSWAGPETSGRAFRGVLRVAPGVTLTLEEGVALEARGGLVVEAGATLALAAGATLALPPGAPLRVEGTVVTPEGTHRGAPPPAGLPRRP
jgi:hypothetical protein